MRIVRGPRDHGFAIIPNAALEDARLSWRARGILAYLLSRPPAWQTSSERLAAAAREGRDAVRSAMAELEAAGYLTRERARVEGGRFATVVVIRDHPQAGDAAVDNSTGAWKSGVGAPGVGFPGVSSKTETKNPPTPPGAGRCPTHGNNPASRCRGCGTSPRQLRAAADAEARAKPPWCGSCDERTRLVDDEGPRRCPSCHPLSVRASS